MKRKINLLLLSLLLTMILTSVNTPVLALSSDTHQPINIESDQQSLDIQHNIVTFTGNVVLTQGSVKIHADKLIVTRMNGEKGQEIIDGYGNPATFFQRQDNGKSVEGHAGHMRYEVKKERVTLTGNAMLKQLDSNIKAEKITYLVQQQQMQAFSHNNKRVTTVLLPSQLQGNPSANSEKQ